MMEPGHYQVGICPLIRIDAEIRYYYAGAFCNKEEDHHVALAKLIRNDLLMDDNRTRKQLDFFLSQLLSSTNQISEATYSFDERNTDNAWVETSAYSFHDESGTLRHIYAFKP